MANELTSANAAQAIPKVVAGYVLPALAPQFVMAALVNRNFDTAIAQAGDTVNIPIAPTLSANKISEAGTVTNQNPSLGNASVVLNTHLEATFTIPNVTQALANPDLIQGYLQPAALAVAEQIESDLVNLYPLLTFNSSVGVANTAPTEATVDSAETALFKARASGQLYGVVSPDCYASLRQVSRFSEARMTGDSSGKAIYQGMLGSLKGIQFVRSQKIVAVSSTTNNLVFTPDAFVLVTRPLPPIIPGTGAISAPITQGGFNMRVVMSYNPQTLSQQFTIDVLYGVAVLRNQLGVLMLS